jgi:hypothetical protein
MQTINKMEFLGAEIPHKLKRNTDWLIIGKWFYYKNHARLIVTTTIFCAACSQSGHTGAPAASNPI